MSAALKHLIRWAVSLAVLLAALFLVFAIGIKLNWFEELGFPRYEGPDDGPVHELAEPQELKANVIEWETDGLLIRVCDAEDNTVFPNGAELTVKFDADTVFILIDGSEIAYDPKPGLFRRSIGRRLGWSEGTVVRIEFTSFMEYDEARGYRNMATGSVIEFADIVIVDVDE